MRWLSSSVNCKKIQQAIVGLPSCSLINPYKGVSHVKKEEQEYRKGFRTKRNEGKVSSIVNQ
ncbi:hypothetical protein [uncultured Gammaproteobacteria bacterium]|nr:hypothetical protein [uncultured Gammaproteobacteria bacterium]